MKNSLPVPCVRSQSPRPPRRVHAAETANAGNLWLSEAELAQADLALRLGPCPTARPESPWSSPRHSVRKPDICKPHRLRGSPRVNAVICCPEDLLHCDTMARVVAQRVSQVVEHDSPEADVFPDGCVDLEVAGRTAAGSISGGAEPAGQPKALRACSSCRTACVSAI